VAARAGSTSETDISSRVDGKAIILVLDIGAGDVHTRRGADVKGVSVMAAVLDVTVSVVDGDVDDLEVLGRVDRETLDRGVLDIETFDGRVL